MRRALLKEALPLAIAIAMNVVYLRLLVIIVSLTESEQETGLYATSFRIFEMLIGIPGLVLAVALPVLAVAGAHDVERLRYGLQRMTEVAVVSRSVSRSRRTRLRRLSSASSPVRPTTERPRSSGSRAGRSSRCSSARSPAGAHLASAPALSRVGQRILPGARGASRPDPHSGVRGPRCRGGRRDRGDPLAVTIFILLARAGADVVPRFTFVWRPLVALAAGAACSPSRVSATGSGRFSSPARSRSPRSPCAPFRTRCSRP